MFLFIPWRTDTQERHRHIVSDKNEVFGAPAQGAHGEYENTQLAKSQKSQEQDFCRFLLLRIEAPVRPIYF